MPVLELHIKGILPYVLFCVRLLSLSKIISAFPSTFKYIIPGWLTSTLVTCSFQRSYCQVILGTSFFGYLYIFLKSHPSQQGCGFHIWDGHFLSGSLENQVLLLLVCWLCCRAEGQLQAFSQGLWLLKRWTQTHHTHHPFIVFATWKTLGKRKHISLFLQIYSYMCD